jgi:hypothetical protein
METISGAPSIITSLFREFGTVSIGSDNHHRDSGKMTDFAGCGATSKSCFSALRRIKTNVFATYIAIEKIESFICVIVGPACMPIAPTPILRVRQAGAPAKITSAQAWST